MIVVVDYGMGNVGSVLNMLRKAGAEARASGRPEDILAAERIILPGVGAFDHAMTKLEESGLADALTRRVVGDRVPFLGICLGMQVLSRRSEEGKRPGLGWLDAETVRFRLDAMPTRLKIPHMGWNYVTPTDASGLFLGYDTTPRFYFVHSYHLICADARLVLATAHYGYDFVCAVKQGNIMGVQFHPEKSHRFGLQMLTNFTRQPC